MFRGQPLESPPLSRLRVHALAARLLPCWPVGRRRGDGGGAMEALTISVKTDAAVATHAASFLRNVARYSQMHRALAAWDYDLLEHAWLWELAWACSTAARRSIA